MNVSHKQIGIDVGGSHITAGLINTGTAGNGPLLISRVAINSHDTAYNILTAFHNCIGKIIAEEPEIDTVGLAFPGPFDYKKGISTVIGVGGKFEKTFGLHIQLALKDFTGLREVPFTFSNDAHCFAAGAYHLYQLKSRRTVFITLGTGFGSAFMRDGLLLTSDPDIPASGAFFNQDFQDAKADDYFSTRWILNTYQQITGIAISSVKELVENATPEAHLIMEQLGANLGRFLSSWLEKYNCDELVIGGNIAKAFSLFSQPLKIELGKLTNKINIMYSENTEECIITGAALISRPQFEIMEKNFRKTSQALLPISSVMDDIDDISAYNIYPSFASGENVLKGFASLADEISHEKNIMIDGYGGLLWESFREHLHNELQTKNKKVFWYDVNSCMKSAAEVQGMIGENLNGDDPVFGKRYTGSLIDFFDTEKLKLIVPDPTADICIVYGTGAALTRIKGKLLYADVPKNEIQFRMRAGSITNLGADELFESSQMYKRFYFVDWPVLNKHKAQILPYIDVIIDEQRIDEISWMKGDGFRNTLNRMLQQPFRARPWFEPGVWGGDWMKNLIPQLNQDVINYAWSFELITPENGIVIEGDDHLLEVSFDFLLYADNNKLLGKAAQRFGTEFPIRFDFLDTYNGGNLSIQCHPQPAYVKEHFGENFTQDETYYILKCEPDAVVYLGFQDAINPEEFKTALINAQEKRIDIEVEKYVQKLPAHKHDLFLIPNGTIHASGKNNLVLEISSTPYIFTFKMYDWLRPGLDGKSRPINVEHAMNNLCFDRKGDYVEGKLVSHQQIVEEWQSGRKIKLPTHEEHFYCVNRYEFSGSIQINTHNQCHVCMLVEGQNVTVSANGNSSTFHYAETFIVPAAAGNYEIKNEGNVMAFVVVAHVKDEHC